MDGGCYHASEKGVSNLSSSPLLLLLLLNDFVAQAAHDEAFFLAFGWRHKDLLMKPVGWVPKKILIASFVNVYARLH